MYRNVFDIPGIECKCISIACEENVGRCSAFGKISSCVTTRTLGCVRFNQLGIWPFVTTITFRIHGACIHTERSE